MINKTYHVVSIIYNVQISTKQIMSTDEQIHLLTARITLLEKNISELQAMVNKLGGVKPATKHIKKTNQKTPPNDKKSELKQRLPNVGTSWSDAEHTNLLNELKAANTIEQIATSHQRTTGGIESRIRKHIKICRDKGTSDETIASELGKDLQFVMLYGNAK